MFFNKFFGKEDSLEGESKNVKMGEGLLYLYMIIAGQVVFVFGLLILIVAMGTILATPLWAVVAAALLFLWGAVLVYKQIKMHWQKVKKTLQEKRFADRNFEISFLGGVITMKVEHNPHQLLKEADQDLLDATPKALLEAEPKGAPVTSK